MCLTKRDFIIMGSTVLVMCVPLALVATTHDLLGTLPSSVFEWSALKVVPTKVGEKRAVFDSPTETLENLEMHITTLNPGEFAHQPHQQRMLGVGGHHVQYVHHVPVPKGIAVDVARTQLFPLIAERRGGRVRRFLVQASHVGQHGPPQRLAYS